MANKFALNADLLVPFVDGGSLATIEKNIWQIDG